MPIRTKPFDVAEHLADGDDQAFLIADALETGDAAFIRSTLNTVARARGMSQIAREAGVTREALYRALAPDGDPRMSTLMGVFEALGVKLSAVRDDTTRTGQKHSITAVFDTRHQAEEAMERLKSSGMPVADMVLLPKLGEAAESFGMRSGEGFWVSLEQLFGRTEDQATYAESIRRGGIMLSVRAEDDRLDDVVDILEQHGSVDLDEREATWRGEGWTGAPVAGTSTTSSSSAMAGSRGLGMLGAGALGTAAYKERSGTATPVQSEVERSTLVTDRAVMDRAAVPAATAGADETIKVYEERLDVGKRSVSRGKVRVHTSVVSREVSESVTLHGETVTINRHAVDRPVAALGTDAFKERTIEVEEFAEETVVAKPAVVVEEIGIRKEAADRVETISKTLRKTMVDIDDARTGGTVTGAMGRFAAEIRDDMEVVGSDGAHVGTVDHMDGARIKLKKADIAAFGEHHYLTHDMVQSVGGKVMLAVTAAEAKERWATA